MLGVVGFAGTTLGHHPHSQCPYIPQLPSLEYILLWPNPCHEISFKFSRRITHCSRQIHCNCVLQIHLSKAHLSFTIIIFFYILQNSSTLLSLIWLILSLWVKLIPVVFKINGFQWFLFARLFNFSTLVNGYILHQHFNPHFVNSHHFKSSKYGGSSTKIRRRKEEYLY